MSVNVFGVKTVVGITFNKNCVISQLLPTHERLKVPEGFVRLNFLREALTFP